MIDYNTIIPFVLAISIKDEKEKFISVNAWIKQNMYLKQLQSNNIRRNPINLESIH